MSYIFEIYSAVFLFTIVLFLQIVLNRVWHPNKKDAFVITLYIVLPAIVFMALCLKSSEYLSNSNLVTLTVYGLLSSSWIATYPALYSSCPTLIISILLKQNSKGLSLDEIIKKLNVKQESLMRVEDALKSALIRKQTDKISLTILGKILLTIFLMYRKILGRKLSAI